MAHSDHPSYTAAEKAARRAYKRRPVERRLSTRQSVVAAALAEVGR